MTPTQLAALRALSGGPGFADPPSPTLSSQFADVRRAQLSRSISQLAAIRAAHPQQFVPGWLHALRPAAGAGLSAIRAAAGAPAAPGTNMQDFRYGAQLPTGTSDESILALAQRAGAQIGGRPMHIMDQGMQKEGRYAIKFDTPSGTTTYWVGADGSMVPA